MNTMKVYVQIIDTKTGIYQHGMIDEPVTKGFEIANALKHFGVIYSEVEWYNKVINENLNVHLLSGNVINTTKVVNVIAI